MPDQPNATPRIGRANDPFVLAPMVIDCDECSLRETDACTDCLVTFICSREPGEAGVIDVAEERTLRLLSDSGLVPPVRHRRRTG